MEQPSVSFTHSCQCWTGPVWTSAPYYAPSPADHMSYSSFGFYALFCQASVAIILSCCLAHVHKLLFFVFQAIDLLIVKDHNTNDQYQIWMNLKGLNLDTLQQIFTFLFKHKNVIPYQLVSLHLAFISYEMCYFDTAEHILNQLSHLEQICSYQYNQHDEYNLLKWVLAFDGLKATGSGNQQGIS